MKLGTEGESLLSLVGKQTWTENSGSGSLGVLTQHGEEWGRHCGKLPNTGVLINFSEWENTTIIDYISCT